ncbi:MAG: cupin domain-containing protein [Pseudomonadota bacterium]
MADQKAPVITLAEQAGFPMEPSRGSERFGARVAPLAKTLGLSRLGAMLCTIEPGRRAFPFHNHLANDELFLILEGAGELRLGDAVHAIKDGDLIGCPKGGPETAHQIVNTGDAPLRYLGISSWQDPDVVEYPDSGKFATIAIAPGADFFTAHLNFVGKREDGRDYWEGET